MTRPLDACPYPKPFAADFNDCPAYQARHVIVLDSTGQPLKPIWSCRLLTSRSAEGEPGHYYGACALGDANARLRWAQAIGLERIHAIQELRRKALPLAQSFIDDVSMLMVSDDSGGGHRPGHAVVRARVQALADQYFAALERLLEKNAELVNAAQMPGASVMQLARQWATELIAETSTARPGDERISADLLRALPESVRVFYGA